MRRFPLDNGKFEPGKLVDTREVQRIEFEGQPIDKTVEDTRSQAARLADTPSEPIRIPEIPLQLSMQEATERDIEYISSIYDKLIFPRPWFVTLAQRIPSEMDRVIKDLSGGGELFPILKGEWMRRIEEKERLLLIREKTNDETPGKLIGVHSYIMPNTEKNIKKIIERLRKINDVPTTGKPWLNSALDDGGRHILMTEDVFTDGSVRNKNLHFEIYRATLEYELGLPTEERCVTPENTDEFSVYYWVNFFRDACMKSRGPWTKTVQIDGKDENIPDYIKDPAFNARMIAATTKQVGQIIGWSHRPDSEEDYIELPSIEDPNEPFEIDGDRVLLIRPYMDVQIPLRYFAKPKQKE